VVCRLKNKIPRFKKWVEEMTSEDGEFYPIPFDEKYKMYVDMLKTHYGVILENTYE
jgi:hypothetical protein